MNPKELASKFK